MKKKHIVKINKKGYNVGSNKKMNRIESASGQERPSIKDQMIGQLSGFLKVRKDVLSRKGRRTEPELNTDNDFLQKFYSTFLEERINRSDEMSSPEIVSAVRIAIDMMGSRPGVISCMDGRIPLPVIAGLPMTAAKGLRLPGGDTPGFRHNPISGELELDRDSQLGKMLLSNGGAEEKIRYEILISHSHCAARSRVVGFTGQTPEDSGLYSDAYDKSLQGSVLERDYGIPTINFVYNPESGYGFMGLSKKDVLADVGRSNGGRYTEDVIESLVEEGRVFSTKKIAEELQEEFGKRHFPINWTELYKDSALRFWNNMQMMAATALPIVEEQVKKIYPERSSDELRMRAVFLLANAYSGWLHNPEFKEHPFETHNEACVVVDYKTKGPFDLSAFIVTPIEGSTPSNVLLAQQIVRANRSSGNITDFTNTYSEDKGGYTRASVPVVYKCEVDVNSSDEHFWNLVRELSWDSVVLTWETDDLNSWLSENLGEKVSQRHFQALITVVETMKNELSNMRRNPDIQYLLDGGYLTVLPLFVSDDRKPQSVAQIVV